MKYLFLLNTATGGLPEDLSSAEYVAERDFIIRRVGELTPDAATSGSVGWPDDQPDRRT